MSHLSLVAALAAAAVTCAAAADPLPARHDGTGTEPLVMRTLPDPDSTEITRFAADRTGIEVTALSPDGLWGQVNYGDTAGWLKMTRLIRQPGPEARGLPMRCYGTEPFWGLHLPTPFFAEYERPEHPETPLQIAGTAEATGPGGFVRLWSFAGEGLRAQLVLREESCSDGMSDRAYGLSAALILSESAGAVHLRLGCCSLTGN